MKNGNQWRRTVLSPGMIGPHILPITHSIKMPMMMIALGLAAAVAERMTETWIEMSANHPLAHRKVVLHHHLAEQLLHPDRPGTSESKFKDTLKPRAKGKSHHHHRKALANVNVMTIGRALGGIHNGGDQPAGIRPIGEATAGKGGVIRTGGKITDAGKSMAVH